MCHDTIRIFWTVSHKSELKGQGLCDIGNAGWKCLIDLSRLHPIRMKSQRVERNSLRVKAIEKRVTLVVSIWWPDRGRPPWHADFGKKNRQLWFILAKSVQCAWIGWMSSKMSKTKILICTQFGSTCQAAFITTPGLLQRVLQLDRLDKVATCCDVVVSWRVMDSSIYQHGMAAGFIEWNVEFRIETLTLLTSGENCGHSLQLPGQRWPTTFGGCGYGWLRDDTREK